MKQVQKSSFISQILSDQVWWCYIKHFLSYFKNCICKFMQANSWHHKLFHLRLSFCIWKVWKGREKVTKIWISQERKELLKRNNTFHSFWRVTIWWKNKHFLNFDERCGFSLLFLWVLLLFCRYCFVAWF